MIDPIVENAIEIAWTSQWLMDNDKYIDDIDSWDEKLKIVELAEKFPNNTDEYEMKGDYYEAIRTYAQRELLKEFGK